MNKEVEDNSGSGPFPAITLIVLSNQEPLPDHTDLKIVKISATSLLLEIEGLTAFQKQLYPPPLLFRPLYSERYILHQNYQLRISQARVHMMYGIECLPSLDLQSTTVDNYNIKLKFITKTTRSSEKVDQSTYRGNMERENKKIVTQTKTNTTNQRKSEDNSFTQSYTYKLHN